MNIAPTGLFAVVPAGQDPAAAGLAALGMANASSIAPPSGFALVLDTALAPMLTPAKAPQVSLDFGRASSFELAPSSGMALDTALIAGAATIPASFRAQFDPSAVRANLLSSSSAVPAALNDSASTLPATFSDTAPVPPPAQHPAVPVGLDLSRPPVPEAQAINGDADGLLPEVAQNGIDQSLAQKAPPQPQAATAPTKPRQEPAVETSARPSVFVAQPTEAVEAKGVAVSPAQGPAQTTEPAEARRTEAGAKRSQGSAKALAGEKPTEPARGSERVGDAGEQPVLPLTAQPERLADSHDPLTTAPQDPKATAHALQAKPELEQAATVEVMASIAVPPAVKASERRARQAGRAELLDDSAAPRNVQSIGVAVPQPTPLSADPAGSAAAASGRTASLSVKPEELGDSSVTAPPAAPVQGASAVAAPSSNGAPVPEPSLPSFEPAAEADRGAPPASHQPAAASASAAPANPVVPIRALREPTVVARPGQIGRDMGIEIARRVASGGDELVVRLSPQDLGRIEVRMSFDEGGSLRAVLTAESQTALDMLRREAGDLGRALADAGVRADTQSLKFGSREGESGSSSWQRQQQDGGRRDGERHPDQHPADTDEAQYRPIRSVGQIDLMA